MKQKLGIEISDEVLPNERYPSVSSSLHDVSWKSARRLDLEINRVRLHF